MVLSEVPNAIMMKIGSYYKDTEGKWIYLVRKDSVAVKHSIVIGRKSIEYFQILEGLRPGDVVVTSSYESFGNRESLTLGEMKELLED